MPAATGRRRRARAFAELGLVGRPAAPASAGAHRPQDDLAGRAFDRDQLALIDGNALDGKQALIQFDLEALGLRRGKSVFSRSWAGALGRASTVTAIGTLLGGFGIPGQDNKGTRRDHFYRGR